MTSASSSASSPPSSVRWSVEQVEAVAPSAAAMSAARPAATVGRWRGLGADDRAVWGSFHGSGAEPYDTMVDHATIGFSCSCPSRRIPCKHSLALLLLWIGGQIADGAPPAAVAAWLARRRPAVPPPAAADPMDQEGRRAESHPDDQPGGSDDHDQNDGHHGLDHHHPDPHLPDPHLPDTHLPDPHLPDLHPPDRHEGRDDRVARMYDGLNELDRWLVDRMRTGLADPSLARFETWDALASRLVDARAGSLANRVRRLAGVVGATPDWHERVLDEIGLLHLLSQAGRRLATLPEPLADRVATTIGWQVRQQDVLANVPDTDDWVVAGRSDTREDRIEVRRFWLRGATSNRWALVLSFAAYRQSLDTSLQVGTAVRADLHRYPGGALRSLVGERFDVPTSRTTPPPTVVAPPASTVIGACTEIGAMLAVEPWLDRVPAVVRAAPTRVDGRWVLTDDTGSLPVRFETSGDERNGHRGGPGHHGLDVMLAVSAGGPIDMTIEWTPTGVVPLTIHRADDAIDIGPRADASFVGAA